jgi:DNA replication protein DnaC
MRREQQRRVREYLGVEESERDRRSLERRIHGARLGGFKSIADFDWEWPEKIDRDQIEDLLRLSFLDDASNVVLLGPSGIGETMIAQNLGYRALQHGHSVRRVNAREMLNDLAAQDSSAALQQRLRRYCAPRLLTIVEVGYLSYDGRYGDLLFEVITRRHLQRSTVLNNNKAFSEWAQVFAGASCVARWSTGSCTEPRSSRSSASPTARRRLQSAPNGRPRSAPRSRRSRGRREPTASAAAAAARPGTPASRRLRLAVG